MATPKIAMEVPTPVPQIVPAKTTTHHDFFRDIILIILLVLAIFAVAMHFWIYPRMMTPEFKTPYQAVLLANGSVYFGKLSRAWSDYPVLTDVYYLQSVTNNDTKQTSNVLVKRGKEWHGPDHMVLNAKEIVLIEPVGESSKVAQLIAESKTQP